MNIGSWDWRARVLSICGSKVLQEKWGLCLANPSIANFSALNMLGFAEGQRERGVKS